jgi:hypothetical protein
MTLPSNSSISHHPHNTVAQFTTALSQNVELEGDWEVGLAEICLPASWYNITSDMTLFAASGCNFNIPVGFYPSVKAVLQKIIEVMIGNDWQEKAKIEVVRVISDDASVYHLTEDQLGFLFNPITDEVGVVVPRKSFFYMNKALAKALGFDRNLLENKNSASPHFVFKGHRPAYLEQSLLLAYIYCDIIEPTFVGDTKVQLLRTVNVDSANRHIVNHIFPNPIYIPLQKKHFNSIEVNIMTSTGDPVPFASGHSVITLHFRRTTNPYFISR